MDRTIIYSDEFENDVERLGGYRAVDVAMEIVIDGLRKDAYGFHKFETDDFSFRYAITEPIDDMPKLYIVFQINADKTVILLRILEDII